MPVNETKTGTQISNVRGTAAIAHWDVPDCGNTEFFINLQTNAHLDDAYGGYCVFAEVLEEDRDSFKTINAIAKAIAKDGKASIKILTAHIGELEPVVEPGAGSKIHQPSQLGYKESEHFYNAKD